MATRGKYNMSRWTLTPNTGLLQAFEMLDRWSGDDLTEERSRQLWSLLTILRGPDLDTEDLDQESHDAYQLVKRRVTGTFRTLLLSRTCGFQAVQRYTRDEQRMPHLPDDALDPKVLYEQMIDFLNGQEDLPDGWLNWYQYLQRRYSYHFASHVRIAAEAIEPLVKSDKRIW